MLIYTKSLGVWVSWRSGKKNSLACCGSVCVCVCEKGRQKVEWEGCVEQCNCSRVMNKSTEINRKRNLWYFCLIFNLWYATLTLNGCLAYFLVDYTHKHVHTNNEIQLHAHTCTHIASGFWNNALFFWTALDSFGICAAHSSLSLSLSLLLSLCFSSYPQTATLSIAPFLVACLSWISSSFPVVIHLSPVFPPLLVLTAKIWV